MTADELREVLKEDTKIDFVSDDNTGDFKAIIWRDTDLVGGRMVRRKLMKVPRKWSITKM